MTAAYQIETARLQFVPLTGDDTDALHALWTDPGVRRFLWDDVVIPREQTIDILETNREYFASYGYGLWGARMRDRPDLIGFGGYWFFHDPPERQILYGLAPDHWGRGLATEIARAMIRYGFEVHDFDHIIGSTDSPNTASRKVMEHAGMRFLKRVSINQLDTIYYEVRREDHTPDDAPFTLRSVE